MKFTIRIICPMCRATMRVISLEVAKCPKCKEKVKIKKG